MALRITPLIVGLSLATFTHAGELNEAQSRYQGAATCIDRLFFEGGYQEGDSAREKLISEFLMHHQLPGYDEILYTQGQAPDTELHALGRAVYPAARLTGWA